MTLSHFIPFRSVSSIPPRRKFEVHQVPASSLPNLTALHFARGSQHCHTCLLDDVKYKKQALHLCPPCIPLTCTALSSHLCLTVPHPRPPPPAWAAGVGGGVRTGRWGEHTEGFCCPDQFRQTAGTAGGGSSPHLRGNSCSPAAGIPAGGAC